jgi:L-ascorbate metabolism protein UlaG (beta-lactamase superfamily)
VNRNAPTPTLRLIGGPTALIAYGGIRLLTDPTFDPPGDYPRPGTPVVLHKLAGPAVPADDLEPIDAVLISHDHHADNLDRGGRAFLPRAGRVITTGAGAERLDVDAIGLEPGDSVALDGPEGPVEVTAVRADHGPPEVAPKNGPVIGFVLGAEGQPTVYVSGDNASVDVVGEIVIGQGPFDSAVLFCGGAAVPELWGEGAYLTLTPDAAVEAARLLGDAPVLPVHQEGWAHFSFGPDALRQAFKESGLAGRLRTVEPGEQVDLV